MTEYTLREFHFNNHGKMELMVKVIFQVRPEMRVNCITYEDFEGNLLNPEDFSKRTDISLHVRNQKGWLEDIKEWLFRHETSPCGGEGGQWAITPKEMTEEDKSAVKRIWMLEDL